MYKAGRGGEYTALKRRRRRWKGCMKIVEKVMSVYLSGLYELLIRVSDMKVEETGLMSWYRITDDDLLLQEVIDFKFKKIKLKKSVF